MLAGYAGFEKFDEIHLIAGNRKRINRDDWDRLRVLIALKR